MAERRIMSLLTTDGELLPVFEERTPSNSFNMGPWMITWDDQRRRIAREIKNGTTLRVLYALPDYLDFETWKRMDQKRLAVELDLSQSSVSHAMAELVERGIIERQGAGPVVEWRLSLNFGWRGNLASFKAAQRKRGTGKITPLPAGVPPPKVAEGILWKERVRQRRERSVP